MTPLTRALQAWTQVLGPERVRADDASLAEAARTTLPQAPAPVALLHARTRDEVVTIVRVAAAEGVPLYPISRGRNWGYGDRCPVTAGCALLDLSGMDRIVEVDDQLGYAVVEPGVTQAQLAGHLDALGGRWWMDATGSGLGASVLGNTVERGFGHSPLGDHFGNTATIEVVLADGSVVQTGLGDLAPARLAGAYPWGIGPVLHGLFSQSNLGIVTRATIWLNPRTPAYKAFVVRLEDEARFEELIERLRPLRLTGTIQTPVHFANDLRVLSSKMRYPWQRTGGAVPLPEPLRRELTRTYRIGAWTGMGGLYGTGAEVRARGRAIRRACRGLAKVIFLPGWKLTLLRNLAGLFPRASALGDLLDVAQPVYDLHRGVPSDYFLASSRWRVRRDPLPADPDPLAAGAGLYWLPPLAPATGRDARALLDRLEPLLLRHGFEPMITCSLLNGRALVFVTTIYFDRDDPDERQRARACHDEALDAMIAGGFVPYRASVTGMARLDPAEAPYWALVRRLKGALDPQGVLAPGRYQPPPPDAPA